MTTDAMTPPAIVGIQSIPLVKRPEGAYDGEPLDETKFRLGGV
jgi:hypothetical protein